MGVALVSETALIEEGNGALCPVCKSGNIRRTGVFARSFEDSLENGVQKSCTLQASFEKHVYSITCVDCFHTTFVKPDELIEQVKVNFSLAEDLALERGQVVRKDKGLIQ